ncbi:GNAT family N-acetyltransferase [Bacillus sp. FSL K6-3431]|uniref:GNAT family N-acetyltransferase n=1 Tax=Bacillus sp. FSL K6-3431 TaxID=2921500 RepID=UPI0030F7C1F8
MRSAVQIRSLHDMEEMKQVQVLEDLVWTGDSIPTHQTITAIKNGGLMLGAFIEGKLVGFNYSFPGFLKGKIYLCSHNMGIHPDHRGKGIGSMLKGVQKEKASEMGYDLITWTFDPLETRNAYLNLSKLRAVCDTYMENCYGEINDGLNNGLPTDRFKVEWWLESEHIGKSFQAQTPIGIIPWEMTNNDLPKLGDFDSLSDERSIHVPVPVDFQMLKRKDSGLALDWRMKTRKVFQTFFAKGYTAIALEKTENDPVHHYVLVKRSSVHID